MALSDQLTDLAARTKKLEDTAAATRAKDRAQLEQERERLNSNMEAQAQRIQSSVDQAQADAQGWWTDTTRRFEQRRADVRATIDQQKAERKLDRAQHNADDWEQYAADTVSWAAYAVDAAEYAVIEAAIARKAADDLVAGSC
jgi:DNA repair exonuclease SbcCD ATPase subunit